MSKDLREILARLDHERRSLVRYGEVLESLPAVTRLRTVDGSRYSVIYSSLSADTADAAIVREIDHHRGLNAWFEWKFFAHDAPMDLLERLRHYGFDIGPKEAVLVLDLNRPPMWVHEESHAVMCVDRVEQVAVFREVAEQVFAKDYSFTATELEAAIRDGSAEQRGYVAYAGEEPVGVGRLYTHPESAFAGLYGGGTLVAHRGRGFYRALVAARARDAIARGARYLQVDALPTSRPILERLGFEHLTDTWPCEWRPA
ncbi:MAG: acetyltransferase [Phycisphaerales bacterium]|nr:acetyltransferase [Phycisphaerales bacterium]